MVGVVGIVGVVSIVGIVGVVGVVGSAPARPSFLGGSEAHKFGSWFRPCEAFLSWRQ